MTEHPGAQERGATRLAGPVGFRAANDNARWRYLPRAGDPVILLFWEDDVQGRCERILFTAIRAPEFKEDEPVLLRLFSPIGWTGTHFRDRDDHRMTATVRWSADGADATLRQCIDRLPDGSRERCKTFRYAYCPDPLNDHLLLKIRSFLEAASETHRTIAEDLLDFLDHVSFCTT